MLLFRLIGLALFITAIFLALAAAITKTTHIQISLPGLSNAMEPPLAGGPVFPPPIETGFGSQPQQVGRNAVPFTSVPIVWPLIIAAGVGLLMWFMLPSQTQLTSRAAKRRSRRQRQ